MWVSYGEAPAFGYGLSPQNLLTCLPPGEARDPDLDYRDFAEWAYAHGVTIVRSYPPSSVVGPRYVDLFERAAADTARFDLERFNDAWYARLREACSTLRAHGIFVHLQLWQAVYWKKDWTDCYYNPDRNVNGEISKHAGPGEFVVDPKRAPALIAHQKEHVRRVLEATGDLGNVFYDVMNEIGNGTGTSGAWIEAILDEIEAWESRTGLDVLVGINDEGRDRAETGRSITNPRMEIAFLDLGRYDEHVETRAKVKKPTFGIRNIDWNPKTKERTYFAGELDLSVNPDSTLESRSRRMYWRLFLAKCQMCAGYADFGRLAYRSPALADLDLWSFRNFQRLFTGSPWVNSYNEMKIAPNAIAEAPAPYSYALLSPRALVAYLESTPGTAGDSLPGGALRLSPSVSIAKPSVRFLRPANSWWEPGNAAPSPDGMILEVPPAWEEIVAVVVDSAEEAPYERVPAGSTLTAIQDGRRVLLSWDVNPEGLVARVHRSSQAVAAAGLSANSLTLIAGCTGLETVDEGAGPGVWEYSIRWKDEVGKRFLESNRVVLEMPDTQPVKLEVRVVKVRENSVVLWAAGNMEPDVVRYDWERRPAGTADWTALASDEDAYFIDSGLRKGAALEYRVVAVDFIGLQGPPSEVVSVTPEKPRVPVAPTSTAKVRRLAGPTLIAAALFLGLALGAFIASRRRAK